MKKPTSVEESHGTGFKGLWFIYNKRKLLCSLITPSALAVVFTILISLRSNNIFGVVSDLISLIISIVPSLLGFLLGGYALMVGFGNADVLQSMTKESKDGPITYYQKFSSVFAFTIYTLAVSLIIGILFNLCLKIPAPSVIPHILISLLNISGLFILLFAIIYSGFLIPTMVLNIFNFSQIHHINLYYTRIKREKEHEQS